MAAGSPASAAARAACSARSRVVSGWRGWALAITGLPAAIAAAKSPPEALPKARGKLFGPKTATGPMAPYCVRIPAAVSMTGRVQSALRAAAAAWRSWPQVLGSSPERRRGSSGSAVSRCAASVMDSACASMRSA